ncbi:inositol transport system substrate-binding protein [Clostridium acetobutylicum]|uniref:Periplasmic sugar-binding protein n=1 Tax=Clostridium acetobutylicum (strain ATCC 824 / DSM 792 / JCM 1419 / IAM 19013 / LMG 5710 / NBRC 13948 / NRRL B-527 / VKM B-1787 / 2291 / W) TaxID=272562 RepID=Q97JD5_CLOAB|nr:MULTISPECIES: sugar ABC transporter substrate-binding protein [Clostridium]AAK79319.1 Periplasmic sugar-binding protein [Clostridium acetobutylicum ATCC 824]ADZ20402.1 Periplasmic sugar-binding protein [Clostridium acetobutylicum EA 2018]AEI33944.1 periplasmic sugar-binding protein [Clostridium acetobutylicum DSM 1731]AWV81430.1 sugar ABC transporter substrate-binding protein [Clostridium acetobutylicum]MBC2393067.1 sugar ABC transporter substrate-binding protein [Clostridium acetobutylicum
MKKTSRILIIFAATCFLLTACAQKKSIVYKSKKYRIGLSIPASDDVFRNKIINAMENEAKNLPDTDLVVVNAKGDPARQKSQISNLVAQKCNAILVLPVDTLLSSDYTQIANDSGIPIISVNNFLKNQDDAAAYVGSDSITSGIMEAEYAVKQLNGKGNVVILKGEPNHETAIKRTEGFKQVLQNYPEIKIIDEQYGDWKRTLGMQITENWIKNGTKFDAILANNDEMAIGAIMALKENNLINNVFVGGIDATPDALKLLKEGSLKVTVFQNAAGQGSEAIKAAYKLVKGEKINKKIFVPYELVVPNDADKYLGKQSAK